MSNPQTPDPSNPAELEARHKEIAAALEPVLADGERWLVELDRDHVHVTVAEHDSAGRSVLRFTHPELYGRLLAVQERVNTAGRLFGVPLALLLSIGGIAAVESGWLARHLTPATVETLANGWVYAFYALLVFFVVIGLRRRAARAHFKREVEQVDRVLSREGITRAQLIALVQGDQALDRLQTFMKREHENPARERFPRG